MNTDTAEKITVEITAFGKTNPVTFHALDTNAPSEYDGFGTLEIARWFEDENDRYAMRTVLVRDEHVGWQTARYASGMHTPTPSVHDVEHIVQELWKRIGTASVK
jgi:hypothetical protein